MANFNKILKLNFGNYIVSCLPHYVNTVILVFNDLTIVVPSRYIYKVLSFLKNDLNSQFEILTDMTAVDYSENDKRFEVVYMLLSLKYNTRIRVKTHVNEMTSLDSVSSLYSSANWVEREAWDMFGIFFKNHPDLRRLLTDYGFDGHPLRKDFPLNGYTAVRYDDTLKIVLYEGTELAQEYRNFDFLSPWNTINR
jgi:NADH/F420H2 dehydrogenase subunit C